jgi:hypothetical protein
MFHYELRQFPHNVCRFNVSDAELRELVAPWVRGQWIEIEERKWNVNQARLTVIEGPEIPLAQLTMGRGWRAAERDGTNVTERVLDAARAAVRQDAPTGAVADPVPSAAPAPSADPAPSPAPAPSAAPASSVSSAAPASSASSAAAGTLADPLALGVQIASLLGPDPVGLLEAWRAAAAQTPALTPSESLGRAERELADRRAGRT